LAGKSHPTIFYHQLVVTHDTSRKPTGAAGGYSDLFPERAIREVVSLLRNSLWWKLTADAAWLGGMVLMVSQYYATVAGGFKYSLRSPLFGEDEPNLTCVETTS